MPIEVQEQIRTEARLVRIETQVDGFKEWTDKFEAEVKKNFDEINAKLDEMVRAVNIQKGMEVQRASMWSIGGGLVGSALTWIVENSHGLFK